MQKLCCKEYILTAIYAIAAAFSATGVAGVTIGELAASLCPDASAVVQSPDFTTLNAAIGLTSEADVST